MSSSYRRRWDHDVFISSSGEDIGKTITDNLYSALIQAGIHTFLGDSEPPIGEEISPQLLRAIEGSRISVVVFSRNYASSPSCLNELVKIMECRQTIHQVVLPVFYDTDPSNVSEQTGSYAEAFDEYEHFKEERVNRWREALTQAGNLSGYAANPVNLFGSDLNNQKTEYKAEFIKKVVSDVAWQLGNKTLHVAKHPVGISSKEMNMVRGRTEPSTNQADEPQGVSSPPKKISCLGLGSYYDQICSPSVKHDVIMDDVQSVFKEKTEPIDSMLEQSNAILDKLAGDEGTTLYLLGTKIQVGVQGLEQGAEEELICLHPEAVSGMEYIQHVDRNDSLEQTRLMESTSGRLVQPGTSASSTKLVGRAFEKNVIWSWLMDDKVSIIGIYGMGGNGKTTMLKNICNELLERHGIFHSIYWVNVPQDFRIDRSKDLIAERLDLNLPSKDDDLCGVVELAKELMMKQKWILILNDLWNSFDLQELGIPVPLNGSKFIMTTRSKMVCQQMNCQNSIRVDRLSDEEAWTLFMEKLGHDRQLSQEEKGIAEDAVRECAGLPLGIVTLAESLKGVHELYKWKITLKRLKESNFWEMEDQIFQILRLSYDCLDDSAKQCFVYCALFDEFHKIERGELIESFIEEGIIKEFDKGHSILDSLENVCLLERIDDGSAVKMHDLLRDMAIQILADEYSLDMAKEERG